VARDRLRKSHGRRVCAILLVYCIVYLFLNYDMFVLSPALGDILNTAMGQCFVLKVPLNTN